MTKKYKLKQWYPSLPSCMEEGKYVIQGENATNKYFTVHKGVKIEVANKKEVENYPEFWEEIEEKNYKVLSFHWKCRHSGECRYDGLANIQANGSYQIHPMYSKDSLGSSLKEMLKAESWKIYSVKRLSDGEVFTVGDRTNKGIIKQFKAYDTSIHVNAKKKDGTGVFSGKLKYIEKVEQPLFTTEDGIDIYEGDSYWSVIQDYSYMHTIAPGEFMDGVEIAKFSTKEKAEEYVEEHKPRFSKAELRKVIKENLENTPTIEEERKRKLTEEVVNNSIKKMESYDIQ